MSNKLTKFNGGKITVGSISKAIELVALTDRTLLLCGAPGVGKSALVYKYAKDNDYDIFTFTGGLITKNNIYGVDFINPDDRCSIHYPAEWYANAVKSNKKVVLFLDDFANANPQEMMILQQILGDRKLGNYNLPSDKFIIVAATNRQGDNANVYTISSPIIGRCCVMEVELNAEEYLEYCKNNIHPSVYAFLDKRRWAISDDIEYLNVNNVPDEAIGYGAKEAVTSTVHPCPRTWKGVSDAIYKIKVNVLSEDYISLFTNVVSGFVGNALSPLFIKSLKTTLNIPTIDFLISNCKDSVNYADHITSDHEAISSIIYTIYQQINRECITFKQLIDANKVNIIYAKVGGTPKFEYPILEDMFAVLNKIKETEFKGINSSVIVANVFDMLIDNNNSNYGCLLGIVKDKAYFREWCMNKDKINSAINSAFRG